MFGNVSFAQAPFASQGGKTLASSLSESVAASDAFSQESLLGGNVNEAGAAVSVFASLSNVFTAARVETVTVTSTPNFAPSTLLASLSEAALGSNTQSVSAAMIATQTESATASDTQSAITTVLAAIAEAATGLDSSTRGLVVSVTIAESAAASSSQATSVSFSASVAEVVSAIASVSVIKTANVYPTGVQLLVSIGDVLVWAVIDDSQNPNWQNINDAQNPGWVNLPS